MNNPAKLVEIFSSIQGEGLRIGEKQTFVRFQGCALRCCWCDTPENFSPSPQYRVEEEEWSGNWSYHPNPVNPQSLSDWLYFFKNKTVSLTGGEPLQQIGFLEDWLPSLNSDFHFFLETNGVLPDALERILPWIHTVSMDFKLESSAHTGRFAKLHEEFLKIAKKAPECYVKIVLTQDTEEGELEEAIRCVNKIAPNISVILQPVSRTLDFKQDLSLAKLAQLEKVAARLCERLRVIPQTHKLLGVL